MSVQTCPKCRKPSPASTMRCACGHEFGVRARRPAGPMPHSLGCFVWLFVVHAFISLLIGWFCATMMTFEKGSAGRYLPLAQAGFALLSFAAAYGLYRRKKWGLNLGAVIMIVSIPILPHGGLIAIVVIAGMSKEKHLLD